VVSVKCEPGPTPDQLVLQFAVADTGIGIPVDKQDRLFQSFSQVDSSTTRQFGGTGLGLAISKRLTELMGGVMTVESAEDKGSTFRFSIVVRATSSDTASWRKPPLALKGRRVLHIEDNAAQRRAIAECARVWDLEVTAVTDLVAAERELSTSGAPFDLLLIDYELVGPDAMAMAIRRLRALPRGQAARAVALTATRLSTNVLPGLGVEAAAYKPLRPASLLESLGRAMTGTASQDKRPPVASPFDSTLATRLPLRLLVADDNAINLKVASMLLKRLGYAVDVAANGIEVLRVLDAKTFDIIFLDVQMPEMDGYEAARRIHERWQQNPHARPRIVAMTGNAMQGDREKCLDAGMDDYISKPVRVDDLQAALEQWGARRPVR
jgi:CheY-like chemotaxis protein